MADEETVKSLAVKLALDAGTFRDGMNDMKRQLAEADSEFKASIAGVKNWGNTVDGLKSNIDALNKEINIQKNVVESYQDKLATENSTLEKNSQKLTDNKARVESLRQAYQESVTTVGKNAEATQQLKKELDGAEDALKKSESQVRNNNSSVERYTVQLNNAQGTLNKMEAELKTANSALFDQTNAWSKASKTMQTAGDGFKSTGEKMSSVGSTLTTTVTIPIVAAGTAVSKFFTEYQDGMAKISTIADTTEVSLDKLGDGLIEVSNDTNTGLSDIQEAEYQAISSGVDTSKSLDYISESAKAAKGGFTDVATAVDGSTTILNAYNESADHANEIYNQMMVAQNLGKTTLGEMAQSIGLVADTTAAANISTKDLFSSLAVETAHGIDTSESISGLREALSNIIKPTSDAQEEAEKLGLQFNVAHLKSVGWAEFLKEIQNKTHGNTEEMGKLFGSVQGLNTMITLTSESGMSLFNESLSQMNSNTDLVGQAFDKVSDTKGQKLSKAVNQLKNDLISFGDKASPLIDEFSNLIKELGDRIEDLTPEQEEMIIKLAATAATVGPVVLGIGKMTSALGTILGATGKAAGGIANFVKGMLGLTSEAGEAVPTMMRFGSIIASALTNPAVLAGGALVALTAAVDAVALKTLYARKPVDDFISSIQNEIQSWNNLKSQQEGQAGSDMSEINRTDLLWNELQKLVDANGNVIGSKERVQQLTDDINQNTGQKELILVGDTIQKYNDASRAIDELIQKKKAEILLEDKESGYKEALTNKDKVLAEQGKLSIEISEQKSKVNSLEYGSINKLDIKKQAEYDNDKKRLSTMEQTYNKNQQRLDDYYSTINSYESASSAEAQGDYKKVQEALGDTTLAYTAATGATKQQLQEQIAEAQESLRILVNDRANGNKNITDADIQAAQDRLSKAQAEYANEEGLANQSGSNIGGNFSNGLSSQSGNIYNSGVQASSSATSGLSSQSDAAFSAGATLADRFNQGFQKALQYYTYSNGVPDFEKAYQHAYDTTPWNSVLLPHHASGTDDWRGGLTWINEKGGEIINLPEHTQIIPHDVSMEIARSFGDKLTGSKTYQFNINHLDVKSDGTKNATLQQLQFLSNVG